MAAGDPADTFRQEAQELLAQLEEALLDLEGDPSDRALIDTAFRALHTLKGSGAMFGFEALAGFAHTLENAFDNLRKGGLVPSPELIQRTLRAKDHMRAMIDAPDTVDADEGAEILAGLRRRADDAPAPPVAETYRIRFRLPADCLGRGTNPLLLLEELRGLGEARVTALTDRVPPLAELDPEACVLGWEVVLRTDKPAAALDDVFIFVLDDMELSVERETAKPAAVAAAEKARPAPTGAPSIRVQAERIDGLLERVGELVIAQSRLKQLAQASTDATLRSVAEEIERLSAELRETTMGIRMVPIGSLFSRFRRVVHDLSRDLGKGVRLVTAGEETELDKTVIEHLNDPLVHLIRNAMDHGLEDGAGRAAAGKAEDGLIHLSATHSGAQVLLAVRDDGRGMDRARIRAKAEEQGLLAPGAEISDTELFQFIFHPGFSTAGTVTSVSGRGVGMDVVKRTIDSLRGTVEVTSQPGAGTQVTLRLPLTLAIIDGLLVRVGRGRYVIPLSAVEECVELSEADAARSTGRSFLNIRGDLVPFLRLRDTFATREPVEPFQKVVIVSAGEQRVGLVVDQVIGDHQTVIKSLSKLHADVASFSGATILGDGSVALILDIGHLIEIGHQREQLPKAS